MAERRRALFAYAADAADPEQLSIAPEEVLDVLAPPEEDGWIRVRKAADGSVGIVPYAYLDANPLPVVAASAPVAFQPPAASLAAGFASAAGGVDDGAPELEKYRRMQRAGLAEGPIRQAMQRDGVDPARLFGGASQPTLARANPGATGLNFGEVRLKHTAGPAVASAVAMNSPAASPPKQPGGTQLLDIQRLAHERDERSHSPPQGWTPSSVLGSASRLSHHQQQQQQPPPANAARAPEWVNKQLKSSAEKRPYEAPEASKPSPPPHGALAAQQVLGRAESRRLEAKPCDHFKVDTAATEFNTCLCGWPKRDHGSKVASPAVDEPKRVSVSPGKQPRPCDRFKVDLAATGFNICTCGWSKTDHGSGRRAGEPAPAVLAASAPASAVVKGKRACDDYKVDLKASGFNVCVCGFEKAKHGAGSKNQDHAEEEVPVAAVEVHPPAAQLPPAATTTEAGGPRVPPRPAPKPPVAGAAAAGGSADPPPPPRNKTPASASRALPAATATPAGPCSNYKVDLKAPAFGTCVCGFPKNQHGRAPVVLPPELPESPQPSSVVGGDSGGDEMTVPEMARLTNLRAFDSEQLFILFSSAGDEKGELSRDAFRSVVLSIMHDGPALSPSDERKAKQAISKLFDALDSDKSGTIDVTELSAGLSLFAGGSRDEKVKTAFKLYDLDGNGFISPEEMFKYLVSVYRVLFETRPSVKESMGISAEDLAKATTEEAFLHADINKDGQLSFEEFQAWYTEGDPKSGSQPKSMTLSIPDMARVTNLRSFDSDRLLVLFKAAANEDGELSRGAFSGVVQRIMAEGPRLSQDDLLKARITTDRLFDALDIDGNNMVDISELTAGISLMAGGSRDDKIRSAFNAYDTDGNGYIDKDEMFAYLSRVYHVLFETQPAIRESMGGITAEQLATATSEEAFLQADANGDGMLSFEEFRTWYSEDFAAPPTAPAALPPIVQDVAKRSRPRPPPPPPAPGTAASAASPASAAADASSVPRRPAPSAPPAETAVPQPRRAAPAPPPTAEAAPAAPTASLPRRAAPTVPAVAEQQPAIAPASSLPVAVPRRAAPSAPPMDPAPAPEPTAAFPVAAPRRAAPTVPLEALAGEVPSATGTVAAPRRAAPTVPVPNPTSGGLSAPPPGMHAPGPFVAQAPAAWTPAPLGGDPYAPLPDAFSSSQQPPAWSAPPPAAAPSLYPLPPAAEQPQQYWQAAPPPAIQPQSWQAAPPVIQPAIPVAQTSQWQPGIQTQETAYNAFAVPVIPPQAIRPQAQPPPQQQRGKPATEYNPFDAI